MNRQYFLEILACTEIAKLLAQGKAADTGACQAALQHTLTTISGAAARLAFVARDYPAWPTICQFQFGAQAPATPLLPITLAELAHRELPALMAPIDRELSR